MKKLEIVPITLATAKKFISDHHRHNKPPTGHKFSIGVEWLGVLVGVATAGRPIARHLDDGRTIEVNRTCTISVPNANSMLYGAVWRAAKAMGYYRAITYIQGDETGCSLKAAGWTRAKTLPPRKSWAESSVKDRDKRDPIGNGGIARERWEIEKKAPGRSHRGQSSIRERTDH